MSTANPRINTTVSPDELSLIKEFAARKSMSVAGAVRHMIRDCLELEEDFLLSELADKRWQEANGEVASKEEVDAAWNSVL